MLLTADVGNTNIKLGIFEGDVLRYKLRFATNDKMTSDEFAVELYTFFQIYRIDYKKIDGAIISSVVPKVTDPLREAIEIVTKARSLVIGPGLKSGMDLKIDRPETLGGDIVCGCVGAYEKFGGPVIVIFMGTATVIAYVDENCVYHGGIIAPGVGISLDALTARASQLSGIGIEPPKRVISKNTIECMKSGVLYSSAGAIDGCIERMEEELGMRTTVVATGGLAKKIIPYCKRDIILDEELLLKGLYVIYYHRHLCRCCGKRRSCYAYFEKNIFTRQYHDTRRTAI